MSPADWVPPIVIWLPADKVYWLAPGAEATYVIGVLLTKTLKLALETPAKATTKSVFPVQLNTWLTTGLGWVNNCWPE